MGALAVPMVPSAIDEFKSKLSFHQGKVANLTELIQRLEANPDLLRVMDLVKDSNRENY